MQLHGAVMAGRTGSRRSNTPVVTNTRRLSSATCPRDRVDWRAERPARTAWRCTTSRKASPGCTGPTLTGMWTHARRRSRAAEGQASGVGAHCTARAGAAARTRPQRSYRPRARWRGEDRRKHRQPSAPLASASRAAQAVARRRRAARGEVPLLGSRFAQPSAREPDGRCTRARGHASTRRTSGPLHRVGGAHRQRRSDGTKTPPQKNCGVLSLPLVFYAHI